MKIEIYDTTLRDGAQGAGIAFTDADKIKIIHALDSLGVSYIEAGNFMAQTGDYESFLEALKGLEHSKITAFGATRRAGETVESDRSFAEIADSPIEYVTIYGKSSLYHVSRVLGTTASENLAMIADTVSYLTEHGKHVFFDAEHFFDGYSESPSYALSVIETAVKSGAETVILCDTNGGMLPDVVGMITASVKEKFPETVIGIHCHNDMGMAEACSVQAVLSGASQVQGTVSGIGERCGNANLNTLIPVLQLKLGFDCIGFENLKSLTRTARYVNEIANLKFDEHEPFVGGYAFTHKAGAHIDAVKKKPNTFEHIAPSTVGNRRNIIISGISGRAAVLDKMKLIMPELDKNSPEVADAVRKVKEYESRGYQYENAEASLMLLICGSLGIRRDFFELKTFKVVISEPASINPDNKCSVLIKIGVGDGEELTAAEGDGPVNALDIALRRAITCFYPEISSVRLVDYKVRVINSSDTTASVVRVLIESTDGVSIWRTIGVSVDIIDASWQALRDSVEYKLMMTHNNSAGNENAGRSAK